MEGQILMRNFSRLIAGAALATALSTTPANARPWSLVDVVNTPGMIDVQLAPNGSRTIVNVIRTDLADNTYASSYLLVDTQTGKAVSLPTELRNPHWSPDGNLVAWLRDEKGGASAIVLTDAQGESRRVLTSGKRRIVALSWSPDGARLAAIETPSQTQGPQKRLQWLTLENDYRNTRPPLRSLWIIDAHSGAEALETHDSWSYGGPETDHDPSWSSDGHLLAVVRQPTSLYGDFEHAQYVSVDIRTGSLRQIVDHSFFAYPASAAPIYAPTEDKVAYTHTWDGKLPSREDVFVDGRDVSAALDRDLWSCGSGRIVWQSGMLLASMMDGVSQRLYRLDPRGASAPRALTGGNGSVWAYSVARDGRIAYVWAPSTALPELYIREPDGRTRQVTHLFPIAHDLPIAPTRYITWGDGNGHTLHGQLTIPAGADSAKLPLIVEPHGGPQCADDSSFAPFAQYLASHGYAYFRPDPPGSDGYGDWSYKAIVNNWGPLPMAADLSGIDWLQASGIGDPSRTFIEGASYGGYLTSWIVTHTQRFRAAVAQVPVTDLLLDYSLSESPNITRRFFGDRPASNTALLTEQSPLSFAAQEKTPLLIMAGLVDTRAPYVQSIEFYKVLAEDGAPVRMLVDPIAGHGPDDPVGTMAWFSATAAWIAEHGGIAIPDAKLPR